MEQFDTHDFWHDLDERERLIASLREGGAGVANREVVWKTKQGEPVHVLISYPQVAYRGGHISFVGGKRVAWIYDISALKKAEDARQRSERGCWKRSRASRRASLITMAMTEWCFATRSIAR